MHRAFQGEDLTACVDQLTRRIESNAEDAAAMLGPGDGVAYSRSIGACRAAAMASPATTPTLHIRSQSRPAPLKLLAIMGPGDIMSNMPVEFLVDNDVNRDIALELLYLGNGLSAPADLPEHDVAIVAVCESEKNQWLLAQLGEVMRHWPRPYINSPASIARLHREAQSKLLANIREFW